MTASLRLLIILGMWAFSASHAYAQTNELKGKVVDKISQEAIDEVIVRFKKVGGSTVLDKTKTTKPEGRYTGRVQRENPSFKIEYSKDGYVQTVREEVPNDVHVKELDTIALLKAKDANNLALMSFALERVLEYVRSDPDPATVKLAQMTIDALRKGNSKVFSDTIVVLKSTQPNLVAALAAFGLNLSS